MAMLSIGADRDQCGAGFNMGSPKGARFLPGTGFDAPLE